MNPEIRRAAEEILADSEQSDEYKRRFSKLLENVTTGNYTDADIRQVIDLAELSDEE